LSKKKKKGKFLWCFSLFTDGRNVVTVCGPLSEKVSRARENPSDGAALPGNGSPREALSNGYFRESLVLDRAQEVKYFFILLFNNFDII